MNYLMPNGKPQAAICALVLVLAVGGCSSSQGDARQAEGAHLPWITSPRLIPGLRQRTIGEGPRAAVLLWPAGRRPPRDVVIYLHGWLPSPPSSDGEWLRHLAEQGNTIIYPVYQTVRSKPESFRTAALAGIAAGLRAAHASPDSVVAIGRTTGGALAFDYVAVARARGLPVPRGVLAVYPGRNPGNGEITPADLSRIPSPTRLVVITGRGDFIPHGEVQAEALLRGATRVPRRRRVLLQPPFPAPRAAPRPGVIRRANRRAFWAPADRLIAEARGGARRGPQ